MIMYSFSFFSLAAEQFPRDTISIHPVFAVIHPVFAVILVLEHVSVNKRDE